MSRNGERSSGAGSEGFRRDGGACSERNSDGARRSTAAGARVLLCAEESRRGRPRGNAEWSFWHGMLALSSRRPHPRPRLPATCTLHSQPAPPPEQQHAVKDRRPPVYSGPATPSIQPICFSSCQVPPAPRRLLLGASSHAALPSQRRYFRARHCTSSALSSLGLGLLRQHQRNL